MKSIPVLLLLIAFFAGCKTTKPAKVAISPENDSIVSIADSIPPAFDFSAQTSWLLGYFDPARLAQEPYSSWYIKGYDDYQFNTESVNNLIDIDKTNVSVKVVMGTWCPDSRREVPRFMRIMDIWQFPLSRITFIGVDDAKLSPVGEYAGLGILRVPTFIIYKNNIEAGRIIENPVTSLEQDIVNILTRNEK